MSIRRQTETDLVRAVLDYLKIVGIYAWRNNTTGVQRTDRSGRQFWTFSGMRGVSDVLGVLCAPRRGMLIAIEAKMPGKHPTPEQRSFLDEVSARGGLALVVSSLRQLEEALRAEGIAP